MTTGNREEGVTSKGQRPTILVSPTVYGLEELLDRIYTVLTAFGYEVWMSNKVTVPALRFGYILAVTKERYKDSSLNLGDAVEKVKALINAHLISLGINPKVEPVELLAPDFMKKLPLLHAPWSLRPMPSKPG
jgi:hypothetical protein